MTKNWLFIFMLPIVCALANDLTNVRSPRSPEASSIIQAVTRQADSIECFDDTKVYLKAGNICYTNAGLALYNGHSTDILRLLRLISSDCDEP